MNEEQFVQALAEHGINLSAEQLAQFDKYYELLVATNEKFNLTAITDKEEVYLKHFYDSLTAAIYYPALQTEELDIIDVGAGAGFPSLPLKIAFPQLKVSIVDSLNKRIGFLNDLATALDLTGVAFYHDRAEIFGGKNSPHRAKYDIVMARAVARMTILSELTLPLMKVNGVLLAMKGSSAQVELANAEFALKTLGGQVLETHAFTLPNGDPREIDVVQKMKPTPKKYPRKPGTPNKEPLGE
ncbi:16S rRNA (guanine(527)-N(7))-methyltransferase RsmG [Periweissella ghanensis]|uniref:Ribosomal RNA small subunit methyltransferase G n=1 Tax=Periweissella ghanensis TaxID=467997 RepID=A0ABN8BSJ6_9LACO|nr:16S rRNA (guanine(527)-N(7))-methyltransferase RsmG [Periweissella ghanensis]MCM0600151.1 16S rRNA (guanine(527)-N(7))-methyltransferase RsmG [Periweissella ghanensis]CAH0419209.1 Ribosomal RNA small subunit methyltransferase G [Periweissella ghanensis]